MRRAILFFTVSLLLMQLLVAAQTVCRDSLTGSLLLNASFEKYDTCNPFWRGEGGIIDGNSPAVHIRVDYWHPENTIQSIRYYNLDCKRVNGSLFDPSYAYLNTGFPGIPSPLPDGKGLVSIEQHNVGFEGYLPENKTDKKYLTTCLATPLIKGFSYGFSFDFGFGIFNANFNDITGFWASPSPYTVGIFGRTDCPDFPLDRKPDDATGCLADRAGWIKLGEVTMRGKSEWEKGFIAFTAPDNIYSIGVGPSCDYNGNIRDTFALYYMDNLVIDLLENLKFKVVTAITGEPCNGHYTLKAPPLDGATYQWFKDDHPLTGLSTQTITIPDRPDAQGNYFANVQLPGVCFRSLPFSVVFSNIKNFTLGDDLLVCDTNAVKLHATFPDAVQFAWQDGSTDSVFTVTANGTYTVTATDKYGCTQTGDVKVVFSDCSNCKVLFPSGFTPNHDGLNDFFRPKPYCNNVPLLHFNLKIFNRWGQVVYNSSNPAAGWDGNIRDNPAPSGLYVYTAEYSFFRNKTIRTQGTITLIR